ncbi:MAG: FAD-dependent oxidoreductase [Actinobacteria bacterium]|nr:FAD-dependent oxidoreductase [Actinomycetota bacterium]
MYHDIAIIGAGLSGLYAARLLQQAGADYVVLEAAHRTGGRILSLGADGTRGPCDMGPSWFWPAYQPRMPSLVRELGLRTFPQANTGALVWEESATECIRYEGGAPDDASMRIHGGTATLIDSLAAEIPAGRVLPGHRVTALRQTPQGIAVEVSTDTGPGITCEARIVICTLPPRLLAQAVRFDPPLPEAVRSSWISVPTWMAGNAKFVGIYERAFWRDAGLSGEGRSRVGPLVEIHDASDEHGLAALIAFVGTPPQARMGALDHLREAAIAQLVRLFGQPAEHPVACLIKDWAADPLVATTDDMQPLYAHPQYGRHASPSGEWAGRLLLGGSESAPTYGGYMEGALEAAEMAVAAAT